MHDFIYTIAFNIFPLFFAIVFHEISHGLIAYSLGGISFRSMRIFSLSSWIVFNAFSFFNWIRETCFRRSPKIHGPNNWYGSRSITWQLYNLPIAIICALGLQNSDGFVIRMLLSFTIINFGLFFFNVIQIPPLNCRRIIVAIIPRRFVESHYKLEPFWFFIIVD